MTRLAEEWSEPRISVAQILTALDDRGLIGLLLILALFNVIPNPPGTSAVLGLPMVYLSWQMMRGQMPWLPQFLTGRSFDVAQFRILVTRAMPHLNRIERLLRPRLAILSSPAAMKILGGVCLVLSIVLILPIPFGNLLPAAAIAIIALGALERDGAWILGGVLFGIATIVFLAGTIVILVAALLRLLGL
ncbi:exopolysaccharide biosynthesis protein [Paracoccus aerius]|uniref:Exopolysaccharide biosynthesis protein n=1 Tax=Paracoccus aerius TaxID=1915382 RepID=A0ABS1S9S2_9RHOB|nr:exopolysaccharide biosynthesis protein [Paracoccus aerius]MBL3675486.1 exopolysaccharide biosynthesis protein [Paracoccus aerius]GHG34470.1 ABC transporter permease [Paracoccus aerius]